MCGLGLVAGREKMEGATDTDGVGGANFLAFCL